MTTQGALKRKSSVEVVDECDCSDDECVTTDDVADVAEDEKEEVNKPLALLDSNVQGFVLS
jgi:hypothetical protein